jgi:hypothetical protein
VSIFLSLKKTEKSMNDMTQYGVAPSLKGKMRTSAVVLLAMLLMTFFPAVSRAEGFTDADLVLWVLGAGVGIMFVVFVVVALMFYGIVGRINNKKS